MAIEGEFPKIGGDVVYASEDNNNELYSTLTKNLIHTTRLTANIGSVDIGYTFAQSDVCSDAGGYNNTINTGQTTARYTGSAYIVGGSLYDNFNDNSINFTLWTTGTSAFGDRGMGSVLETGDVMRIVGSAHNVATGDATQSGIARIWSNAIFTDYLFWIAPTLTITSSLASARAEVRIAGSVLLDSGNSALYGNYGQTGSWEIVRLSGNSYNVYRNGTLVSGINNINIVGGSVEWNALTTCFNGGGAGEVVHEIENVQFGHWTGSNLIITSGAIFSNNIKSIFSDINGNVSGPGISITYDASSNGGSAYQQTNIGVGSWTGLLNAGSMGVIKYKLNNNGSFTPFLFGYGYMVSE